MITTKITKRFIFLTQNDNRFNVLKEYVRNIMAKIVQTLTRASNEYEEDVAQSLVRDLDAVLRKT